MVRHGAATSAVVVVGGGPDLRATVAAVYAELEIPVDPATAGALDEELPGVTPDARRRPGRGGLRGGPAARAARRSTRSCSTRRARSPRATAWRDRPRPRRPGSTIAGVTDRLHFTESDEANALLVSDPLALLIGFALDQQVTVQKAFVGPLVLRERLGTLDAARLAATDLEPIFRERPAIHRFPGSMAKRVRDLTAHVAERYDGDAARVWTDPPRRPS